MDSKEICPDISSCIFLSAFVSSRMPDKTSPKRPTASSREFSRFVREPRNSLTILNSCGLNDTRVSPDRIQDEDSRAKMREGHPDGQGQSRLIIPALKHGTARNMNTIAKLAEMAAEL
jgi:uncharacterized protein (DUF1697 family)